VRAQLEAARQALHPAHEQPQPTASANELSENVVLSV